MKTKFPKPTIKDLAKFNDPTGLKLAKHRVFGVRELRVGEEYLGQKKLYYQIQLAPGIDIQRRLKRVSKFARHLCRIGLRIIKHEDMGKQKAGYREFLCDVFTCIRSPRWRGFN